MQGRRLPIALAALLAGCPTPGSPTGEATSGHESQPSGGEGSSRDLDRALSREGVLALGTYVFELPAGEGDAERTERAVAELTAIRGDELGLRVDGAPRHVARQSAWPMLCLRGPLAYGEGDLRIMLSAGAPVYVAASDATHARVGPAPLAAFGKVLERGALATEGCVEQIPREARAFVGLAQAGDQACLFTDPDPVDESDGLPIPAGAPLEELDRDDEWARVRVATRGGTLEGWLPSALVANDATGSPDWAAAALRPERCTFPGRQAASEPPSAWIERRDESAPMPDAASFERVLRESDPRVRGCWEELPPEERPRTPARVDVRIAVDGDGQVQVAAIVRSEGAPAALSRCIAERVRRVRFAPSRTGVTLRRTYAFDGHDPDRPSEDEGAGDGDDDEL